MKKTFKKITSIVLASLLALQPVMPTITLANELANQPQVETIEKEIPNSNVIVENNAEDKSEEAPKDEEQTPEEAPVETNEAAPSDNAAPEVAEAPPIVAEEITPDTQLVEAKATDAEELPAAQGRAATLPSELDGSKIEQIVTEWVTKDTTDDGNASRLSQTFVDNKLQVIQKRIIFALSGQNDYPEGTVQIKIPKVTIMDRFNKPHGRMTLAVPAAPDRTGLFSYTDMGDYFLITNTKKLTAASSGVVEVSIRDIEPSLLVEGRVSKPFDAEITILTHKNNPIQMKSNAIDAVFNTEARIFDANKKYTRMYETYPESFPAELKPANPENYYYGHFYMSAHVEANQYFDIEITDNAREGNGDNKNAVMLGVKARRNNTVLKGNNTGSFTTKIEDNYFDESGEGFFADAYVAYPKSDFQSDIKYNLKNKVTYKMTSRDDKKVTTTSAESILPFSPLVVTFPTGSFIVKKHGDGISEIFKDNKAEGIYGTALNKLLKGQNVDMTFEVNTQAYAGAWTLKDGGNAGNVKDYGFKTVKVEVEDYKTTFHTAAELTSRDFEFRGIEIKKPHGQEFFDLAQKEGATNQYTGTVFTTGHSTSSFGYTKVTDDRLPDIKVEGKTETGAFVEYGAISYKTGALVITPKNGATVEGKNLIFPSGVVDYKMTTETNLASVSFYAYPIMRLKPTEAVLSTVRELYKSSDAPKTLANNYVKMYVTTPGGSRMFINEDVGRNQIQGFAYGVKPQKTLVKYENNTSGRFVDLEYKLSTRLQTNLTNREELNEAIKDDIYTEETSGVFYDLLPKGVTPDTNSIKLRVGDKIDKIEVVENYKGTGRILLKVTATLKPKYNYEPNFSNKPSFTGQPGYYDEPEMTFKARYSWFTLQNFGSTLDNYGVYESGRDDLGLIDKFRGEPDNPRAGRNSFSANIKDESIKDALTDISTRNSNSFVYATDSSKLVVDTYSLTSLSKQVDVNGENAFNDGLDNLLSKNVYEGGKYSYQIMVKNSPINKAKDIVFYDNLENYVPTNDKDDHGDIQWRGIFQSIDISALRAKGVNPVVYYSTTPNLVLDNTDNRAHNNLQNTAIWSTTMPADKKSITAIAVDASKKTDGTPFVLNEDESLLFYLHMRAPLVSSLSRPGEEALWYDKQLAQGEVEATLTGGAHAYNNAVLISTMMNTDTGRESAKELIRYDYTKVGLKPYQVEVKKAWSDDNNRDGIRPSEAVFKLLANGQDTNRRITLSDDNEWTDTFISIPYLDEQGNRIIYTIAEVPNPGYDFVPGAPTVLDDGLKYNTVNHHTPERINIEGIKEWDDLDESKRPKELSITLLKNGLKFRTMTIKPDLKGEWKFLFENLFKYENGQEIKYSITETNYITGYVQEIADFNIKNTYSPYGNIKLSKEVQNQTDKAKEVNPDFTFTFLIKKDGASLPNSYEYETTLGRTGEIASGGNITLKAGEIATIKNVDSDLPYEFKEINIPAGYKFVNAIGDKGSLQAGQTKEVKFTNKYSSEGTTLLDVNKVLTGRVLGPFEFQFDVFKDGEIIASAPNTVDGSIPFGLFKFTDADLNKEHELIIKERPLSRKGIIYDLHEEVVRVTLEDNGDGTITVTPVYDQDGAVFNNQYKAKGEVILRAFKEVQHGKLEEEFQFELLENGQVKTTGKSNVRGEVVFEKIEFNETHAGQVFTYRAREVAGNNPNMIYDNSEVEYVVEVFDNGDGTLSFNASAKDLKVDDVNNEATTPLFVNKFKPGSLSVSKDILSGDPNKPFNFRVKLKGNEDIPTGTFELKREQTGNVTAIFKANDAANTPSPQFISTTKDGDYEIDLPTSGGWMVGGQPYFISIPYKVINNKAVINGVEYTDVIEIVEMGQLAPTPMPTNPGETIMPDSVPDRNTLSSLISNTFATLFGTEKVEAAVVVQLPENSTSRWLITDNRELIFFPGVISMPPRGPRGKRVAPSWEKAGKPYNKVIFQSGTSIIDGKGMFANSSIDSIDISNVDFSKATDLTGFLAGSTVSEVITNGVTTPSNVSMSSAFSNTRIKSLDISGFFTGPEVPNATATYALSLNSGMLAGTTALKQLKIGNAFSMGLDYVFYDIFNKSSKMWRHEGTGLLSIFTKSLSGDKAQRPVGWYTLVDGTSPTAYFEKHHDPEIAKLVIGEDIAPISINTNGDVRIPTPNWSYVDPNTGVKYVAKHFTYIGSYWTGDPLYAINPQYDFGRHVTGPYYAGEKVIPGSTYEDRDGNLFTYSPIFSAVYEPVREIKINFDLSPSSETRPSMVYNKDAGVFELSAPKSAPRGMVFDRWMLDGRMFLGRRDLDALPNGSEITLTANWVPISNNVNIQNGEFRFQVWPGEKVTLDNIPAGLSYEVYEETEEGWILVSEKNSTGIIPSNANVLAEFVNDYRPNSTSAVLKGMKRLDGQGASGFKFGLYKDGALIEEVVSLADGTFKFGNLVFDNPGVYNYTIAEIAGNDNNINYDSHVESIVITVNDNGAGLLSANVSKNNVEFNNTTKDAKLLVSKAVVGTQATNIEFDIKLTIDGVSQVIKLTNGQAAEIPVKYGQYYKVEEINVPEGYVLESIANEEGVVGQDEISVVVTNSYKPKGSSIMITATKVLEGRELAGNDFEFELIDANDTVIETVRNDASGNIFFSAIPVTGNTTYKIREVKGTDPSIAYDESEITVVVTTTDDGRGNLVADVQYDNTVFTNRVTHRPTQPTEESQELTISKEVVGTTTDKKFAVTVNITKDGNVVPGSFPWSKGTENGSVISGGKIEIGHGEVVTIENLDPGMKVQIVEDEYPGYTVGGNSVLETTVEYGGRNELSLVNIYEASGQIEFKGIKTLEGADIKDYGFIFKIFHENDILQSITNGPDGSIDFRPIYFSHLDHGKTFAYTIYEENNNMPNIEYDTNMYEIELTVTDNGDGTLTITPNIDVAKLNFTNRYDLSILPETGLYDAYYIIPTMIVVLCAMYVMKKRRYS